MKLTMETLCGLERNGREVVKLLEAESLIGFNNRMAALMKDEDKRLDLFKAVGKLNDHLRALRAVEFEVAKSE